MNREEIKFIDKSFIVKGISLSYFNAIALVASILVSLGIVLIFMSQENALYWSDFNYYQIMATLTKNIFLEHTLEFPLFVYLSTKQVYNFLYVIPLLPFTLIFGDSRESFITALTLIYQLPFVILLSVLATKLLTESKLLPSRYLLWISVLLALSTPTIWGPTLRGYPDFGPASLILIASLLYLKDKSFQSKKTIFYIGLCLALAPLIRRHFFYLSFAQALAMLVHQLYLAKINNSTAKQFFKSSFLNWISIGLVSTAVLSTLGFLFVTSIFKNPFFALYKSAYVPIFEGIGYLVSSYGVIAFSLSIAGFYLCSKYKYFSDDSVFILTLSILSFFVWPTLGKHLAIHYTIYSDMFVVLGITSFLAWLIHLKTVRLKSYLLAFTVFFWSSNFALGLSVYKDSSLKLTKYGMLTKVEKSPNFLGRLFSANYGPIQRKDKKILKKLFQYLGNESKGNKKIFIASDNGILGADILRNTERELTGQFVAKSLNMIEPPMLDSRDSLAMEGLLSSELVVICEPFNPMYKEKDSKDLKVVLDCFSNNWDFSKDFEKLPGRFSINGNSTVSIYKRIRPTTVSVAVKSFDKMRAFVKGDLIGQPKWISTDEKYVAHDRQNKEVYKIGLNKTEDPITRYLVSSNLVKGNFELIGSIQTTLALKPFLKVLAVESDGTITILEDKIEYIDKFNIKGTVSKPSHLVLVLYGDETSDKLMNAKNLVIKNN